MVIPGSFPAWFLEAPKKDASSSSISVSLRTASQAEGRMRGPILRSLLAHIRKPCRRSSVFCSASELSKHQAPPRAPVPQSFCVLGSERTVLFGLYFVTGPQGPRESGSPRASQRSRARASRSASSRHSATWPKYRPCLLGGELCVYIYIYILYSRIHIYIYV